MSSDLRSILAQFQIKGTIKDIAPFGNGHINDTYLGRTKEEYYPDYILQRKNHQVFKDIPGMMNNIIRVTNHIRNKLEEKDCRNIDSKVITHISSKDSKYYHNDINGNYWTVFLYIAECKSYEKIEAPEQAYMAGIAFGAFQNQLSDLPGKPLNETIIDFHNINFRLDNFKKALKINYNNRISKVSKEIDFAQSYTEEMRTLIKAEHNGQIPNRITHNDTKINNILFDNNDNILCVIDLDTVMPGLVHFDFGDAIRTAANTADEDETDLSKITINHAIFESFTKGFLKELKNILNSKEKKLLAHSAKFMTYIMGLRFLTDYIEGDVYYKTAHSDHNIERARAQFKLVSEIEKHMKSLEEIVEKYS